MTTPNTQVLHEAANQRESARLVQLRLTGFVGRQSEQAAIRELIDQTRPSGGYVLVTGEAGAGKSSLLAQLIVNAGLDQTPQHFIALTPGRAYQLDVLRSIVAQLLLKHDLASNYFPADSYPALRLEFGQLLQTLAARGISETIYLDGLDQLQPEVDGTRDISFLPLQLPLGIVIVLGSRPNETIDSLALEHGVVYQVPPLHEQDAIGRWQQVQPTLEPALWHGLAQAVRGNALLVELAANVLRHTTSAELLPLLDYASADATNLFRLSLARIEQAAPRHWQALIRPLLAVLLITQEPLEPAVLAGILEQSVDAIAEALPLMSDWVSVAADQRVALRHLLFHDFLIDHEFAAAERRAWHGRMAQWGGTQLDQIWQDSAEFVEQARRWYARQHYITHLDCAEQWEALWQVIDAGDYGEHKVRFEPSTRLYGLDLDRARESVIAAGQSIEQQLELLPRLWRYSLLRTSLTAHADQWHDNVFVILAAVGRLSEALAQIDICSDQARQVLLWSRVIQYAEPELGLKILQRMEQTARSIHNPIMRDDRLHYVAMAYADQGLLTFAYPITLTLTSDIGRDKTLAYLIDIAIKQRDFDQAWIMVGQIQTAKYRIKSAMVLAQALMLIGEFTKAQQLLIEALPFAQAEHVVEIKSVLATIAWRLGNYRQSRALLAYARALSKRLTDDVQPVAVLAVIRGYSDRAGSQRQGGKIKAAVLAVIRGYLDRGNLAKAQSLHPMIRKDDSRIELVRIYLKWNEIAIAAELTTTITDEFYRDRAYAALAAWYCKYADFAKAEQAIELITGDEKKRESLCLLATSYAQNLQIKQTLVVLQRALATIEHRHYSAKSLLQIGDTYARQHLHDHAWGIFAEALAKITTIDKQHLFHEQMSEFLWLTEHVKRYGYEDLCERVVQTALLIGQRATFEYSLLFEKATIYFNHGEINLVRQMVDASTEPQLAVQLLQMLLRQAIEQQNHSQAQTYVLEALTHARKIENPRSRLIRLCELGDTVLASEFQAQGQLMSAEASQLVPLLQTEIDQEIAIPILIKSYAAYAMLADALKLAQSIIILGFKDYNLRTISRICADNGEIEQAYATLNLSRSRPEVYARNLCEIIVKGHSHGFAMLVTGYYAEIIELLRIITDRISVLECLKDLAIAQINYGSNQYLPSLLDSIRTMRHPALPVDWYVKVLCEIARAYIKQANYPDFADWLAYAHSIAQSRPNVTAYHYVAMEYIQHATDSDTDIFLADMLGLADGIEPSSYANALFTVLANSCTAYAVRGHPDFLGKAYQFAMAISVPFQRAQVLRIVANGYAQVDDRVMVETIIAEISRLCPNYLSIDAIALNYAQRGDLAFAQTLIANDEVSEKRDAVLDYLIPALLQTDAVVAAYQISHGFTRLTKRIKSLHQIINYYVERQHIAESVQIIQAAWRNCGASADVWELRKIVLPLDSTQPWLGMALLDSVPWVEQQLARLQ